MHEINMLVMCALSPVMMLGTLAHRPQARPHARYAQQVADYRRAKARIEADAEAGARRRAG